MTWCALVSPSEPISIRRSVVSIERPRIRGTRPGFPLATVRNNSGRQLCESSHSQSRDMILTLEHTAFVRCSRSRCAEFGSRGRFLNITGGDMHAPIDWRIPGNTDWCLDCTFVAMVNNYTASQVPNWVDGLTRTCRDCSVFLDAETDASASTAAGSTSSVAHSRLAGADKPYSGTQPNLQSSSSDSGSSSSAVPLAIVIPLVLVVVLVSIAVVVGLLIRRRRAHAQKAFQSSVNTMQRYQDRDIQLQENPAAAVPRSGPPPRPW